MNISLRLLAVAMVMAATAFTSRAASIGVNFGTPAAADSSLGASQSAGVVSQINWMNYTSASASGVTLFDSTGAATTATMTFTGAFYPVIQVAASVDETNGDELLNNSYAASFSAPFIFTISSVPYATYSLITYVNSVNGGPRPISTTATTTTEGPTTLWGATPASSTGPGYVDGNTGTAYTYTSAVGATSGTATPNGNYFLFTGLTGGIGSTLTISMNSTTDVAQLTAFQIVDAVPEPGSALLLLGGCCVLGLRRMRGQR
jgi:hypothetical protein